MAGPVFTVFTPTFNRAHTLHRVYESLCAQTFRDFEWLVVDDGSDDGTPELVERWMASGRVPIRYVRQSNAGKPAATNRGVAEARGELFLISDSDDSFVPWALERLLHHWRSIPEHERHRFSGVTAQCVDERGRRTGGTFPRDPLDSDSLELYYRFKVRGDHWGFVRTDVLRQHPFPTLAGARHVPEDVVWRAVARRYRTRFVNEVLRIYHQDAGDQLTRSSPRSWARFREHYARRLCEDRDWLWVAPVEFLRLAANYARFCFLVREPVAVQLSRLPPLVLRALWVIAAPVGLLAALRDLRRERRLALQASLGPSPTRLSGGQPV